jgi:6-phosphogluconolactonase
VTARPPPVTTAAPDAAVLRRVADPDAAARAAAEAFADAAARAVAERGRFTVALAGGTTPRRLYQLLADPAAEFRGTVPWDRVHVFFGDERHVPPDHPDSNHRMVHEALLSQIRVASVHRIHGEEPDAGGAAADYQADLARFFDEREPGARPPPLDLVLLGLGADGHTASLFPGSGALLERSRWVVAPYVARLGVHRITLTLPVLDRAREVVFLVSGAEKADAVARVLAPEPGAAPPPAACVRPASGALRWIVDSAAAARLPSAAPPG